MYNLIFVAYYKFRLLFRNNLIDEWKDKSDTQWAAAFVTIIQVFQLLGIWTALISIGEMPDNFVELMPMAIVLLLILYTLNVFYFFNFERAQVLVKKDKVLSEQSQVRKVFMSIILIILSIVFFFVSTEFAAKLHVRNKNIKENAQGVINSDRTDK